MCPINVSAYKLAGSGQRSSRGLYARPDPAALGKLLPLLPCGVTRRPGRQRAALTGGFRQSSLRPNIGEPAVPTLWNDLARTFLRAVPLLLAFGAVQIAANAVLPYALEGCVTWLLLPIINYFLYRIALFDLRAPYLARYAPPAATVPSEAPIRFLLALSLPFLLAAGVFLVLAVMTLPESETGRDLLLLSGVGALWLALSIFGILLPAAAARNPCRSTRPCA